MERPQVCPRCAHRHIIKNGWVKEKQRWQCKSCRYSLTRTTPRGKPLALKALCITLYGVGLALRTIEKILPISREAVRHWVSEFSETLDLSPSAEVRVVEADEMWHYLQKKSRSSGSSKWLLIRTGSWSDWSSVTVLLTP